MPWQFIVSFVVGLVMHGILIMPEDELPVKLCVVAKFIFAVCLQMDIFIIAQRVFCGV